jgi:hypothetical protein
MAEQRFVQTQVGRIAPLAVLHFVERKPSVASQKFSDLYTLFFNHLKFSIMKKNFN